MTKNPNAPVWRRRTSGLGTGLLAILFLAAGIAPAAADELAIDVLSNRADLISADDALVQVVVPPDVATSAVRVALNGTDVTGAFGVDAAGRFVGLVTGLLIGDNHLEAFVAPPTLKQAAEITITNYPIGGPVFSGAQLLPFICARTVATPVTVTVPNTALSGTATTRVSGLNADPTDDRCNAASKFTLFYQPKVLEGSSCTFTTPNTAGSCFQTYDPSNPPADADIANFTNDRGDTVRSIILVERGTVDRGIYDLVTFYDPSQPNTPQNRQRGWNGKLLWSFGAASGPRRFEQPPSVSVFNASALSRGFMVASGSLSDHDTNSNDTLAAEFVMMVKEHIAETYGEIRYTIGTGCSGGSILQYNIAAAYPGILNGIQPNCTFPDTLTTAMEVVDCGLLGGRYYTVAPGNALTTAKRAAINGHINANQCLAWVGSFLNFGNPTLAGNCGSGFPTSVTYDPVLRPDGVRCTTFDHDASMLGTFVDTDGNTKAQSPLDNVGVQYGLQALAAGVITAEDFVQLNEGVGTFTSDLVWVHPQRGVASMDALHTVYSAGLVSDGHQLAKTAIIDLRGNQGAVDIHLNWRALEVRARLDNANGNHDNQLIWAFGSPITPGAALALRSFLTMDTWLTNIENDASNDPIELKVENDKPAGATDMCIVANGATDADIVDVGLSNPACPVKFQSSPRQVAGGPRSEDVFKCQLKPLDFASPDYDGVVFSDDQKTRLAAVFPDGVCDWTLPGVGQVPSDGGSTFKNGPGGEPLGEAPISMTVPPVCGDGDVIGEACDDGNTASGDGCSSSCTVEPGYACTGSPSTCVAICGDGLIVGGETCDDGNTSGGDGCTATCTVEEGWTCAGSPSACAPICGDGLLRGGEACDEGAANGTLPSCCAATCQFKAAGTACDDGNACTTSDTCDGGSTCVGGAPPDCDDHNTCTVDSCDTATGCVHDGPARDGFACDDGNACTQGDVCTNGQCAGTSGADADGDGYCDATEAAVGCNPNDAAEIPAQPTTYGGGHAAGDVLITYLAPKDRKVVRATDPSCATAGICAPNHFCTAGKIADPCTTNADCNLPANTCRVVANYGAAPDLAARKPFKLNKTVVTGSFEPLTPGCSRKVGSGARFLSSFQQAEDPGERDGRRPGAPRHRFVHLSLRRGTGGGRCCPPPVGRQDEGRNERLGR